jgi:hypothetical protein
MSSQIAKMRQLGTCFFSILHHALPIDAPNHPALLGDARSTEKKISEIKFEKYRGSKFRPCCPLAQGASLSPSIAQKTKFKSEEKNLLRFSYSWGNRLKIVLYLAETEIH